MDEECKHEMPISTCFDCKPKVPQQSWAAKYETVCAVDTCLRVIDVGELVKWNAEGTKTIHAFHGRA